MPVEIMLLPTWFPFHLNKISYWARTVIVPLLVLAALKPRAQNPRGVGIDELFLQDPADDRHDRASAPHQNAALVLAVPRHRHACCASLEPLFPKRLRAARDRQARSPSSSERLNGEDGLGAIYPPMANTVMMYEALGYPRGSSAARDRATRHRQAAGDRRGRGLLPALRLADLGHRADCHALLEAGGEARAGAGQAGARLAASRSRCSTSRATGP